MGNTSSSNKSNDPLQKETSQSSSDQHKRPSARRRESFPSQSSNPSASQTQHDPARQKSPASHHEQGSASKSSHARGRSQTTAHAPSIPLHDASQVPGGSVSKSVTAHHDGSGYESSAVGHSHSRPVQMPPRPVPTDPNLQSGSFPAGDMSPNNPASGFYTPSTQYTRPPRMPLPIEKEDFVPGSPIISPADVPGQPIGKDDEDATVERKGSVLSSQGDEEDAEDFALPSAGASPTLDTLIEWKQGGERVYVTGSFSGWNKKHRLHRNGPSKEPGVLSAIIPLPAGTHHLTFLVDGSMRIAGHMPTAVDYTNVLINYIEVSIDDIPKQSGPIDIHPQPYQPSRQVAEEQTVPAGYHRPDSSLPPSPNLRPADPSTAPSAGPSGISSPAPAQKSEESSENQLAAQQPPAPKRVFSDKKYHSRIPDFLQDLDAPEESSHFARANAALGTQPAPPSLPMFLNKSILNGQMPMKDDASVLIMPNHTVLNHLATTSIKNNVLATSATTRYKRKYVTTIMHKPTSDTGS